MRFKQLDAFTPASRDRTYTNANEDIRHRACVHPCRSPARRWFKSAFSAARKYSRRESKFERFGRPGAADRSKRMLAFGLLLGILGTIILLLTTSTPPAVPLRVIVQPESAQQVDITVDAQPLVDNDSFRIGRAHTICAQAAYFEKTRKRHMHSEDNAEVTLRLIPFPRLEPQVTPKGVPYRVLVDRVVPVDGRSA